MNRIGLYMLAIVAIMLCVGIALFFVGYGSSSDNYRLKVFRVAPLEGGSTIDVIRGEGPLMEIVVGDTVSVNLSDSEIDLVKKEDGRVVPNGSYGYVVKSVYLSKKY